MQPEMMQLSCFREWYQCREAECRLTEALKTSKLAFAITIGSYYGWLQLPILRFTRLQQDTCCFNWQYLKNDADISSRKSKHSLHFAFGVALCFAGCRFLGASRYEFMCWPLKSTCDDPSFLVNLRQAIKAKSLFYPYPCALKTLQSTPFPNLEHLSLGWPCILKKQSARWRFCYCC